MHVQECMMKAVEDSLSKAEVGEDSVEVLTRVCSACLQVFTERALLTYSCCDHQFCEACIDPTVFRNNACPLCNREQNEDIWTVHCRHKSQGCEWTGELGSFGRHLDVECGFINLECEFSSVGCCAKFLKKDSAKHREENVHCHMMLTASTQIEYRKARQIFEQKIRQKIQDYILQNSEIGGMQTQLQVKDQELRGVKEQFAKEELEMIQMYKQITEVRQKLEKLIKIQEELTEKDQQLAKVEKRLQEMEKQFMQRKPPARLPPAQGNTLPNQETQNLVMVVVPTPEFTMTHYEEHKWMENDWFSSPFYTHQRGYKMCLRVRACGQLKGQGSHVSVFVHLMRGENDDFLVWPFYGNVVVELMNQRKDRWHLRKTIPFDNSNVQSCARVMKPYARRVIGKGFGNFVSYSKLGYSFLFGTEYLKNDCLKFRVIKVTLFNI